MFFRRQKACLEHRKTCQDQIVFCTFIDGVRQYGTLPDHDAYAAFILSRAPGAKFCNELLWSHTATYIDIDSTQTLGQLGFASETDFQEQFCDLLKDCFAKYLNAEIGPGDLFWSCSTREGKTSYHVKVNSSSFYWPVDARKTMKNFFKLVNTCCLNTKGFHYYEQNGDILKQTSILDISVYSANRCLRSLGCCKPGIPTPFTDGGRATHSQIVNHSVTISPEGRKPFELKSVCRVPQTRLVLHTNIFQALAEKLGAEYVSTMGSLIRLRTKGCRICPISQEENRSDNCYFLLKDRGQTVMFGCHNAECTGRLLKVHEFPTEKEFKHYEDYFKLVNNPDRKMSSVVEYMKSCVRYIDCPSDPFFCTTSQIGLPCFNHRLTLTTTNCAKSLFKGYADIVLDIGEEKPVKFSGVLQGLLKERKIPTFRDVLWLPHLKSDVSPEIPRNKLNTFSGFALEQLPETQLDFEKTQLFDLLQRLGGANHKYLFHFLAAKLQKPYQKLPIALCFVNSLEGSGKGTFGAFLEKIFCCSENSYVSFNTLESFSNHFNAVQAQSLFICLEEITAKMGGLKAYAGLLKDKISATTILCEVKNRPRVLLPWYASIIIFSNEFNVISVSRTDRRLVLFESNSEMANNGPYFKKIYQELNDLQILRSAFQYFSSYDVSAFNYRALPPSDVKDKLVELCTPNAVKFQHFLFAQYSGRNSYEVSEEDIYESYKGYCMTYGIKSQSSRHSLVANLKLNCPWLVIEIQNGQKIYSFTDANRIRALDLV